MVTRKPKAQKPATERVEQVAADIAAVDGVESATVAEGDEAPVVVAEVTDDMPRWMKYRIEHGLPIDDAPAGEA